MEQKLKVGILGATGMVGQRFLSLLENHPWFEVTAVAASPGAPGRRMKRLWEADGRCRLPCREKVKNLVVMNVNEVEKVASGVDFVFSAVDMTKEEIRQIEDAYAKTETPVVSNNSAHRWTPDVPMVVPEINAEHFAVIRAPEEASWNQERICGGKAQLFHSELRAGADCLERVRALRGGRYHVSGHFRSRQDL